MIETWDFDIKKVFFAKNRGSPQKFLSDFSEKLDFRKTEKTNFFPDYLIFEDIILKNGRKSAGEALKFVWGQNTIFQ